MPGVLFLGGGRRVELARRFRDGYGCRVVGYEGGTECPLAEDFEVVAGLPWRHPDFPTHLREACDAYGIQAVVPLQDEAVLALAAAELPSGVSKVCSSPTAAYAAYDKMMFRVCFVGGKLAHYYPDWQLGKPAVIKPRFGFGGKGVRRTDRYPDEAFDERTEVAQLELPGPEFTADGYWNRSGQFIGACVRERVRVAGGEVIEAEVVWDDAIESAVHELGTELGVRGPVCFQFRYGESEIPQVLECNARLGGGSTLSCEAGLDLVGFIVKEYVKGEVVEPFEPQIRHGLRLARSYRDHFFDAETYRG